MIILTTGKGGVGKTTMSATTALELARQGFKTVVASVDPAHSLGDVLDVTLGSQATNVAENLDALEVRLSEELTSHWGSIQSYLTRVFQSQGVEPAIAQDAAYLPGLEELASLLRLHQLKNQYDYVVLDCPPTGSTLRYLNLPEAIRWYMEKFFPTEKMIVQAIGPVAEKIVGLPMPTATALDQLQKIFEDILGLRSILTDPKQAIAQVVTTPESVVLKEAERAVGYLHVHQLTCGRIIVNRATKKQCLDVTDRFAPVPALSVAKQAKEPIGIEVLTRLAKRMYKDVSVLPPPLAQQPVAFKVDELSAKMHMQMPKYTNKKEFKVGRQGDDLIIDMGAVRRHLPLPPAIARQNLVKAAWQDNGIQLEFRV